jgi:hypothetical protein
MVETLETARAFGIHTRPRVAGAVDTSVEFDPYAASIDQLIDAWLPLTFAFNSINRSMGVNDLYPFVLGAPSIVKLNYVYNKIHFYSSTANQGDREALKAVVASLKRSVASP